MFLQSLEFFWQLRIAHFIRVEVHDGDPRPMFHFADTKVVQERSPLFVFFQILGDVLGKENVPLVPAAHHPLRHVEASTGEIGMTIYIYHPAHRTAVHPHPEL